MNLPLDGYVRVMSDAYIDNSHPASIKMSYLSALHVGEHSVTYVSVVYYTVVFGVVDHQTVCSVQ